MLTWLWVGFDESRLTTKVDLIQFGKQIQKIQDVEDL
jgi:hypothetical protein